MYVEKYKKILSDVNDDMSFKTSFGQIHNLVQLRDSLLTKGKDFYDQYANGNKNDFASWVEHVFEDHELALSLSNTAISCFSFLSKKNDIADDDGRCPEIFLILESDIEIP